MWDALPRPRARPDREAHRARPRRELRVRRARRRSPTSWARARRSTTARRSISTATDSSGDARRQAEFVIRSLSELSTATTGTRLSLDQAVGQPRVVVHGVGLGVLPDGGYRAPDQAMAGPERPPRPPRRGDRAAAAMACVVRAAAPAAGGSRCAARTSSSRCRSACSSAGRSASTRGCPAASARRSRVGFGAVEKVAMLFDEPSGPTLLHTHIVYISDHAPFELPLWVDLDRISGVPGAGRLQRRLVRQAHSTLAGPGRALELTLARLREILGRDVPRPRRLARHGLAGQPLHPRRLHGDAVGRVAATTSTCSRNPSAAGVLFCGEHRTARHSPRRRRDDQRDPRGEAAAAVGCGDAQRRLRA